MQTGANVMLLNQKNHLDYINLGMEYDFTAILISLMNYSLEQINSKEEMKTGLH